MKIILAILLTALSLHADDIIVHSGDRIAFETIDLDGNTNWMYLGTTPNSSTLGNFQIGKGNVADWDGANFAVGFDNFVSTQSGMAFGVGNVVTNIAYMAFGVGNLCDGNSSGVFGANSVLLHSESSYTWGNHLEIYDSHDAHLFGAHIMASNENNCTLIGWGRGIMEFEDDEVAVKNVPLIAEAGLKVSEDGSKLNSLRFGTVTLSGGCATIVTPYVSTSSLILATPRGNPTANVSVVNQSAGMSFVIQSSDTNDNREVVWTILEP